MSDSIIIETDQYLTFSLGEEHYALNVVKVKEVLELAPITQIPKTPDYMSGVINIRGSVIPIIDLRRKFDMQSVEATVDTGIIVVEVNEENDLITIGVIADKVQEVIEITPENIEPAPRIGNNIDTRFINGMGKYNENFLIILNVNELFTEEEITTIEEMSTGGS